MGVHYEIRGAMMSLIEVAVFSFWVTNEHKSVSLCLHASNYHKMLFNFNFSCYDELEFKIEAILCVLMAQFQFWVVDRIKSFSLSYQCKGVTIDVSYFFIILITLRGVNNDVLKELWVKVQHLFLPDVSKKIVDFDG